MHMYTFKSICLQKKVNEHLLELSLINMSRIYTTPPFRRKPRQGNQFLALFTVWKWQKLKLPPLDCRHGNNVLAFLLLGNGNIEATSP